MDYLNIRRELIRSIRGNRTQGQLSRKLGYRTNQVYRWEAGIQSIRWKEFVKLCGICRADLRNTLIDLLKYEGKPASSVELIQHFIGETKIAEFTRKRGLSRFKVARWLSSRSELSLDDVLELIEQAQNGLFDFVFRLSPGRGIPSFESKAEAKRRYIELLQRYPWVGVVRMCLDVGEYQRLARHEPGYLARKLGIDRAGEAFLLSRLEELDAIRFEGGKYRLNDLGINVRGDPAIEARLIRYWAEQAAGIYERTQGKTEESVFHLVTFSASRHAIEQIEAEVKGLYAKVRSILSVDSPQTDEIKVLAIQLMGLSDMSFELEPDSESPTYNDDTPRAR